MSLRDINKRYIDEVIEYFIKEIYTWKWFKGEIDIESMLNKRLEDLNKKDFVIDWKVNANLRTKAEIRDAKLAGLLYDVEDEGSFVEVLYRMQDRSMWSVRISEEELIAYRDGTKER